MDINNRPLAKKLIREAEKFSKLSGWSLSTIANYAVKDGNFFKKIKSGHSFTDRRYDQVMAFIRLKKRQMKEKEQPKCH